MGTVHLKGKEESRPMLEVFPIGQCFWQKVGEGGGRDKELREAARYQIPLSKSEGVRETAPHLATQRQLGTLMWLLSDGKERSDQVGSK